MTVYRVAFIGCSGKDTIPKEDCLPGRPCSFASAFSAHPRTTIVAATEPDRGRLERFASCWKVKKLYSDYLPLLSREKPDILCVAVHPYQNEQVLVDASMLGVKGLVFQRLFACTSGDASSMIDHCRRLHMALVVGREMLCGIQYQTAKWLIKSGRIGTLRTIAGFAIPGSPGPDIDADPIQGPLFEERINLIDLFQLFGGEIAWVIGHEHRPLGREQAESDSLAMIHFAKGGHGFLEAGGRRRHTQFEIDIHCTHGRIRIADGAATLYTLSPSETLPGVMSLKEQRFPRMRQVVSPYSVHVDRLLSCLEGQSDPVASGLQAVKSLSVIDAIHLSSENLGKLVFLQTDNDPPGKTEDSDLEESLGIG